MCRFAAQFLCFVAISGLVLAEEKEAAKPAAPATAAPSTATVKKSKEKPVKRANWPPKDGVKTPGVLIPAEDLKSEATVSVPAAPDFMYFGDSIFVASKNKEGIQRVDAKTNKVLDTIAGVKKPCGGFTFAFGSLWIGDCAEGSLVRIDTKAKNIKATISASAIQSSPAALAASPDSLWALSDEKTTLTRVDPEDNRIVSETRLPAGCNTVGFGETALWVTCPTQNSVLRIDPATSLVTNKIDIAGQPSAMAFAESSVWVLARKDGKVVRIDPKTNKVSSTVDLKLPNLDGTMSVGEGNLWVSLAGYPITRIDMQAEKEKVVQQFAGEGGGAIHVGSGSVWLTEASSGNLVRLDPKRIRATMAD